MTSRSSILRAQSGWFRSLFLLWTLFPAFCTGQFLSARYIREGEIGAITAMDHVDIDGDGIKDLLLHSHDSPGFFAWDLYYLPGASPTTASLRRLADQVGSSQASVGDLDLDGDQDVVIRSVTIGELLFMENLGAGQLWQRRTLAVPSMNTTPVQLADLDGDGDKDLVLTISGTIKYMLNQGGFVFGAPVTIEPTNNTVVIWDPDGNSLPDLLMWRSNTVYHYANLGGAAFAPAVQLLANVTTKPLLDDLNGDGAQDLVAMGSSSVVYHPRTGTISFGAAITLLSGFTFSAGSSLATTLDIDDDLDKDILISVPGAMGASYLRNDGGGNFSWSGEGNIGTPGVMGGIPSAVRMDMDLDGDNDLAFCTASGGVSWLENSFGGPVGNTLVHTGAVLEATPIHADLDGDGLMDVVAQTTTTYRWCRNTGNAVFSPPQTLAQVPVVQGQDASPYEHFADADGDGDADLFSTQYSSGNSVVACRANIGNGVFGAPVTIHSGTGLRLIHFVKDYDGDGDRDLLVRTTGTNHIFFLNNGSGVFTQSAITVSSSYNFQDMVDLDGDGDKDLYYVLQRNVSGTLTVDWGRAMNNAGTFSMYSESVQIAMTQGTDQGHYGTVLDVDRDGIMDMVFWAYQSLGPLYGYRLYWKRSFFGLHQPLIESYDGGLPKKHVTADVDHDGDMDLIVGSNLFINGGAGVMLGPHYLVRSMNPVGLLAVPGDLDSDGQTDLTLWSSAQDVRWTELGTGNTVFSAIRSVLRPTTNGLKQLVDLDLDGDVDILNEVDWMENDGNAEFQAHTLGTLYPGDLMARLAADLDGDNDLDIVAGDRFGTVCVLEHLAGNTFAQPRAIAPFSTCIPRLAGDMDGDGDMDIVYGGNEISSIPATSAGFLRNNGNWSFQKVTYSQYALPTALVDYDADGDLDIAARAVYPSNVCAIALRNSGTGSVTQATSTNVGFSEWPGPTFGDVDGDGDKDFIYSNSTAYWRANTGSGNISSTATSMGFASGIVNRTICYDIDNDGDNDVLAMGGSAMLYRNSGGGAFLVSGGASGPDGGSETHAADMNGDGDIDVVGSDGRLWISLGHEGQLTITATVKLGGAYSAMNAHLADALRAGQLIPLTEPYTALGYVHVGGGGGESIQPSKLNVTGPDAIVDWVIAELRDPANPAVRLESRSALLQRDGGVVDLDGVSPLRFDLPIGSYHLAIRHRNHLGAMTAAPITFVGGVNTVNFTNPATATFGTNPQNNVNGTMVLWPGDVTFDGVVKYVGPNNDRDPILSAVGGSTPTNVVSNVYNRADTNMDGSIRYVGANNDRDVILQTVGGSVPTATRVQQLP